MDLSELQHALSALAGLNVVCIGDLMVDRFVQGEVSRISAEAPVPIMARLSEQLMLGAAGNVARNICALGGRAILIGVVGDDVAAAEAGQLIGETADLSASLVSQAGRPTAVKTRFIAAGQQLLRVDEEQVAPIAAETETRLIAALEAASVGAKAILLSDYGKGVATPGVIAACLATARRAKAPLIIDSKARSFDHYGPADLIKPNAAELSAAVGMPTDTDAEVEAALARALEKCDCAAVLVTRGAKGMSLARRGGAVRHFRGDPREVFDVSGAGDTALAALGLGLAAGGGLEQAVELALLASGVVVGKPGTAVVSPAELVEAELSAHWAMSDAKIATPERMLEEVARWRARGLKIGFTNGCFDILHRGHVAYLAQARGWCDRLVVGLNSDRSVRALKGEGRPVNDLESRALVLAGLGSVDLVVSFDEQTPIELIRAARPDVLVKGADYSVEGVVGHDVVQGYGGEVRLATIVDGYSTTAALRKLAGPQ